MPPEKHSASPQTKASAANSSVQDMLFLLFSSGKTFSLLISAFRLLERVLVCARVSTFCPLAKRDEFLDGLLALASNGGRGSASAFPEFFL
jgi:hypothetical protein